MTHCFNWPEKKGGHAAFLFQSMVCTVIIVCLVRWDLLPALHKLDRWKHPIQLLGDPLKKSRIGERA